MKKDDPLEKMLKLALKENAIWRELFPRHRAYVDERAAAEVENRPMKPTPTYRIG